LVFVAVLVLPAGAAQPSAGVTAGQLEQALAAAESAHQADADLARQLSAMVLTERLSMARMARLRAGLPGEKSQQALIALADSSVFLDPPAAETPAKPTPDSAELRRMLVAVVNYVNTTVRQLPNFIATRETTRFEDRPLEDIQGEVGMTTLIYLPLHVVGSSNLLVTYRDGHEVVEKAAAKSKQGDSQERGLSTQGVFGPILTTVVGDALKGQITWSRWEEGASATEAVFHYTVPKEKSHYSVGFCCVPGQTGGEQPGSSDWHTFAEIAAYRGEIAFDPASGAILRITLEADMPANEVVSKNGMMVEYGAVEIGGKTYICPLRSVSLLMAHAIQPPTGDRPVASYKGPLKTFLNDTVFEQYRRFGSEIQVLTGSSVEPAANPPVPVQTGAASKSPQPAPVASASLPTASETTPAPAAAVEPAPPPASDSVAAPSTQAEPEIAIGASAGLPDRTTAPPSSSLYTLKIATRLVDVSLVASDKKGHPVNGLQAEDVEVYDNGRKQTIKFFSSFHAVSPASGSTAAASPGRFFSNQVVAADAASPAASRAPAGATILLIDESHIAWADMNNARTQMLQFLAAAPADEQIGLYTMSGLGFRVLAEVTTDHAALSARLRKWTPSAQSAAQAQSEETRNRQSFDEVRNVSDLNSVNGNEKNTPDGMSFVDPQLLTMGSNPARASLVILIGVARRLGAVPGHKNLVWVSSDNVFADFSNQEVGTDKNVGFLDGFALRAQEAMNDAHVAVYPLDVSQLETSAIAADTQHRNVELNPTNSMAGSLPVDYSAGRNKAEMLEDIHPIQWPVRQVAEATGGRAIRRSGNLAAAMAQIVEDGHATYLLSFSPDQAADGQYHAITVKLAGKQRGLTLRYRSGYLYAKEPATLKERFQQMVWQPVDANELTVSAQAIPMDAGVNLKIDIAAGGLGLEQQADRWMDRLDVFFLQRDDAGLQAQVDERTLELRLKSSTYQQLPATGIPCEYAVQLKRGVASLRILVVDENTGRMGSVTIPASAIGHASQ
jgi:VWFA-related protein